MAYLDYNGLKKHIELTKAYVNGKLAHYISQEQLAAVAVSGSYNDLTDKPDFSAEGDIEEAIAAHNSSVDPHSNLFQIVESGTEPVGLDLLAKMIQQDPCKRISAKQALHHPYFNDLDKSQFEFK